jgi:hypothetical protein
VPSEEPMLTAAQLSDVVEPLRRLLAEQVTPVDVANFILVCVALIVLATVVVFVAGMGVLWSRLEHGNRSFTQAFVDSETVRDWFAETAIVASTMLLLIYTFHLRHSIVERIATSPSKPLVVAMAERGLLDPTHTQSLIASGAAAEAILKPLMTTGNAADALEIADKALAWPGEDADSAARAKWILLGCAVGLLLAYIAWELIKRYLQLRKAYPEGKEAKADYARTFKGVAAIAICIALLLAAAAPMGDKHHLTNSVLAAMRDRPMAKAQDEKVAQTIAQELTKPGAKSALSADPLVSKLRAAYAQVEVQLTDLQLRFTRADAARDTAFADSVRHQMLLVSNQLSALSALAMRLERLEARADSGGIVVFADSTTSYSIAASGTSNPLRSGRGTAFYRVASGKYDITRIGPTKMSVSGVVVGHGDVAIRCIAMLLPGVQQAGSPLNIRGLAGRGGRGGTGTDSAANAALTATSPFCRGIEG